MQIRPFILILVSMCALVSSCAIETPEDPTKFLYNFEGTTFRQLKFRSIDDENAYRFHQGIRTIKYDPAEYTSTMSAYMETGLVPCYGSLKGSTQSVSKEQFLEEVNGVVSDTSDTDSNGVYDIFEPYGASEVAETTTEEKVDLVEYFYIVTPMENGISPGCPVTIAPKLYYQYLFYRNGDLIMRDYNREIQFFFRPQ